MSSGALHSLPSGKRVFGVPLTTNVQQLGQPLPPIILAAISHLRRTGIYAAARGQGGSGIGDVSLSLSLSLSLSAFRFGDYGAVSQNSIKS